MPTDISTHYEKLASDDTVQQDLSAETKNFNAYASPISRRIQQLVLLPYHTDDNGGVGVRDSVDTSSRPPFLPVIGPLSPV
jgi:hypothetical protein